MGQERYVQQLHLTGFSCFVLFCFSFHIINTNKFFQCLFFFLKKKKGFASCLSHRVGEMQIKPSTFSFVSDASFNRTQTSQVFELVPLFQIFFFFNTDEARLSYVSLLHTLSFSSSSYLCDHRLATFFPPRILTAFARLYDHIGKLFDLGCFANVVKDGERF